MEVPVSSNEYVQAYDVYSMSLIAGSTPNVTIPATSSTSLVQRELQFVYSRLESVLLLIYLYIVGVISIVLNLLVIASIVRNPRLHNPENVIILLDSINNVIFIMAFHTFALAILQTDFSQPNFYVCQICGTLSNVAFLTTSQLLMIYAYERYLFFCDPIKHAKYVTNRRMAAILVIVISLSYGWNIVFTLPGRVMTYTAMMCLGRSQLRSTVTNFLIYGAPSVAVAMYSVFNISRVHFRYNLHHFETKFCAIIFKK
jgi:hypothetical protein